jgi:tRNA A-37 threonylcarbamoyl transferase component Bud32
MIFAKHSTSRKKLSLRRLFKNNADFIAIRSWQHFIVCDRTYFSKAMHNLLLNPDIGMTEQMLKVDYTTTVAVHQVDGKKIVIKRYNIKDFWHGIKRAISRSRATKCWRNSHRLLSLDIPTATPIAMVERRVGPFRRESYYIYEYLPGELASDIFVRENLNTRQFDDYAKKIILLIKKLLLTKISHGDLKATNFVFSKGHVYFIDLDAMQTHRIPWICRYKKSKEVKRFLANWDDDIAIKNFMDAACQLYGMHQIVAIN